MPLKHDSFILSVHPDLVFDLNVHFVFERPLRLKRHFPIKIFL
jgi:hypothetical protein